jgi:hypothetical protein
VEDNSIVTVFDVSTTASSPQEEAMGGSPGKGNSSGGNGGGASKKGHVVHSGGVAEDDDGQSVGGSHHGVGANSGGDSIGADGDMQMEPFVTNCCFDKLQRRLVVSTREQVIQLWNFNNGECLQVVQPQLPTMKFNIPLGNVRISAISCDDAFLGVRKTVRKFMFFGSTNGFAIGLQDVEGDFQEEPNFVLIEKSKTKFALTDGPSKNNGGVVGLDDDSIVSSEASFSSASGSVSLYSSEATGVTTQTVGTGSRNDTFQQSVGTLIKSQTSGTNDFMLMCQFVL